MKVWREKRQKLQETSAYPSSEYASLGLFSVLDQFLKDYVKCLPDVV